MEVYGKTADVRLKSELRQYLDAQKEGLELSRGTSKLCIEYEIARARLK
jgi:hypothetical protein